jgi:sarcosine oxidase delta subunit
MAHDDEHPLDALFQKIKIQWNVTLTDSSSPQVAIEGHDGHRGGDDSNKNSESSTKLAEEGFVLLVQRSLGSNLRILSSGGVGVGDEAARHGGKSTAFRSSGSDSSSRITANGRPTNVASAAAEDTTPTLYERAGVRSPPERAWRDLHGSSSWLEIIAQSLGRASDAVVWVQTLSGRDRSGTSSLRNVETTNLSLDPFGWNADGEGGIAGNVPNLENLDRVLQEIQDRVQALSIKSGEHQQGARKTASLQHSRGFVPVVLQSATPIFHRHGFVRTRQFLQELQRCCPVLVVPTTVESLSRDQHWSLEGMASAILTVEEGAAVMLRRGIRESTNVVRETLELDFDDPESSTGASQSMRIYLPRVRRVTSSTRMPSPSDPLQPGKEAMPGATTTPQGPAPPGKPQIQLSISDEDAPRAANTWRRGRMSSEPDASTPTPHDERRQPNIIVQDDDPEFDDYDEEDPDDDLDL